MNIENPISTIMSKYVKTLHPTDSLWDVKVLFDRFNIHHIPITEDNRVKGIISKSDFNFFGTRAFVAKEDRPDEKERLSTISVADAMTIKIVAVRPEDPIRLAMEIFRGNHLHALPVKEGELLVGIVTPIDIMNHILNERMSPTESNIAKNTGGHFK